MKKGKKKKIYRCPICGAEFSKKFYRCSACGYPIDTVKLRGII